MANRHMQSALQVGIRLIEHHSREMRLVGQTRGYTHLDGNPYDRHVRHDRLDQDARPTKLSAGGRRETNTLIAARWLG